MAGYVKDCDKANMKKAIIKQEEIFRQQVRRTPPLIFSSLSQLIPGIRETYDTQPFLQVHELHRLYRIQKLLMRENRSTEKAQLQKSNADKRKHCQTLDLELPATTEEYLGNGDEYIGEESEIELTLATGSNFRKKKEQSQTSHSGTGFSSSSTESEGVKLAGEEWMQMNDIGSDSAIDTVERKRHERLNQLPWSIPCLSLKMT